MAKRKPTTELIRCPWAKGDEYVQYHDNDWGVPIYDDRLLFEFLILEGAQAGLSWITILKKRDNYRRAFDEFIWGLVDGKPMINSWKSLKELPAHTAESDAMSKELKPRRK